YLGSDVYGLGRGFQTYRFYREQGARRRAVYLRSDAVLRRVEHWLERGPRNPFLLYVHVTDPHFPYVPPPRSVRPFWTGPPSSAWPAPSGAARRWIAPSSRSTCSPPSSTPRASPFPPIWTGCPGWPPRGPRRAPRRLRRSAWDRSTSRRWWPTRGRPSATSTP